MLEVVSLPAMSWVRASAVSSARPSLLPFSSLPSISRASRSIRCSSPFSASSLALTLATAIPARSSTAARPLLKNESGSHFAWGFRLGRHPSVPLTSPRRFKTSTAGA